MRGRNWTWVALTGALASSGLTAFGTSCSTSTPSGAVGQNSDASATDAPSGSSSDSGPSGADGGDGGNGDRDGGSVDAGDGGSGDGGGDARNSDVGTPNSVVCGSATCATPANLCCAPIPPDGGAATCVPAAGTSCNEITVACDDKADCTGGNLCCSGNYGTFCAASCGVTHGQMCKGVNECVTGTCTEYTCFGGKVSVCDMPPATWACE